MSESGTYSSHRGRAQQSHTCRYHLEHFTRGPSEHTGQPFRAADHETVPTITLLHNIEGAWLQLPSSVNNHLHYLRRERGLVLFSDHVCGGDVAPSSVRLGTRVNPEALVSKFRSPLVAFSGGEVVVEYLLCVLWIDVHDPFLRNNRCLSNTCYWIQS